MRLLAVVAWYSTWSSIVSDVHNRTNTAQGRNMPYIQYCTSGLQQHIICTEDVTAVRRTLQRLQVCSRDTIASPTSSNPQNECQLIDILGSLLAVSICYHSGRHRRNAVIHAGLQPTRGLRLKEALNFCVRPSGGCLRPQHIAKGCCG